MKTLYLECRMGASGDMLMGALSELIDQREFVRRMNGLGLPGVQVEATAAARCGIHGTHMRVTVHGHEELEDEHIHEHDHHHEHHHDDAYDHHHHHEHRHLHDVRAIIDGLDVSAAVKKNAGEVYALIAEAEGRAHRASVDEVHFHEVGALDAVADVVGCCLLMEMVGADRVVASPVAVGGGTVSCAHGILPVPAPATAALLEGIPSYAGPVESELCTPTGAALLRHFASSFGPQPLMRVEAVGYGLGSKDFPQANCLRAFLGGAEQSVGTAAGVAAAAQDPDDQVVELSCNLDDQTGEDVAYACQVLRAAGAVDVWATPLLMKKDRPGTMVTCLCRPADRDTMVDLMFAHLTTIGIREARLRRHVLAREVVTVETSLGPVRVKRSWGHGVEREKLEHDDLARVAREQGLTLEEVRRRVESERA